jgi:hypothetical protein
MDPLDHLTTLRDGMPCTVCGERVPGDALRLLAWRDDLAFLQLDCPACLSTTLGFSIGGRSETAQADSPGAAASPDASGPIAPVSGNDVLDMHQFLAGWQGDLASLVRTRAS